MDNSLLTYPIFKHYDSLIQFTTTTFGGVSKGNYSSLNLSLFSKDNVDDVIENRRILSEKLNIAEDKLFIPYQTHDDKIGLIDSAFLASSLTEQEQKLSGVDALITRERNVCIGITTADCVPILIYDPANHALGVAHAGWKGTVAKIGAKMVLMMQQEFASNPKDLIVGIGPSISPKMFEVGNEVGEAFVSGGFNLNTISYRNSGTGKLHIDLWQANKEPLLTLGIKEENIEVLGICTQQSENYFSARRQTIHSGRILTGGVLK